MSDLSPRRQYRAWIREELEGREAVSLPELTETILVRLKSDAALLDAWLSESLAPLVAQDIRQICSATRSHVVFGDEALAPTALKAKVAASKPRWQAWLEHAGDRHVRLMDMQKEDLLAAADEREQRGMSNIELAALWRELAARLPADRKVGDLFTEEQIEALAASLRVEVNVVRDRRREVAA